MNHFSPIKQVTNYPIVRPRHGHNEDWCRVAFGIAPKLLSSIPVLLRTHGMPSHPQARKAPGNSRNGLGELLDKVWASNPCGFGSNKVSVPAVFPFILVMLFQQRTGMVMEKGITLKKDYTAFGRS